jgi:tetratricopeptide (TPR) repeat protein
MLHDGRVYLFQGQHPVRVRRSLPNDLRLSTLATEPPIRVLLVSPRPEDDSAGYIDHRVSAKPVVEALSHLGPELVRFKLLEPPTYPALVAELARAADAQEPYHVIHFDGHGVWSREHGLGMLCFENPADLGKLEGRRNDLIDAKKLAETVHERHVPLFFLEACQTAKTDTDPSASVAGRLLESGVASVVAMSHSVLVKTAEKFIEVFYRELLSGMRVGQAMLAGQRTLHADAWRGKKFDDSDFHLQDWFVPVLFQEEQDPQLIRQLPGQQVREAFEQRAKADLGNLPELRHEFVGRGRDLLKAERMLAPGHGARYLAVRGSGGEGKTTFAVELARWLVATRRHERAAFASVEQVTGAEAVVTALGQQLVAGFDSEPEGHRQKLVERALRERRTVLVIDNMESLARPGDAALLAEVLALCRRLGEQGDTLLIFTSREALPAPFDRNEIRIGRLDRASAITLLGKLRPKDAPESRDTQEDLERLVDAVGCHPRSLVLIAREAGVAGVRHAAENLGPIMRAMEAKHPHCRENSLLASAELSLRRLPEEVRTRIRRLAVFHGGGSFPAIASALEFQDRDQLNALLNKLVTVGLAEWITPDYVRFDPALLAATDLSDAERVDATRRWAEAMEQVTDFLNQERFKDVAFARSVTLLDLPNLVVALEYGGPLWSAERVVKFATRLEPLVAPVNRPKALERIQAVRKSAAARLDAGWSHERYLAESQAIDQLIRAGSFREALTAAKAVHDRAEAAGEAAYSSAAYDLAVTKSRLGRVLKEGRAAAAALPYLQDARQRFLGMAEAQMASASSTDFADCLTGLGRYEEAASAYQQVIAEAGQRGDRHTVATNKGQLATVRMLQKQYDESLRLLEEARKEFDQLNEPPAVAKVWHQIGMVQQAAGQSKAAEAAYRQSLEIKTRTDDKPGQASSLGQLANLYSLIGRTEESARLTRQAADIYTETGDVRNEGVARNNLALQFINLKRLLEARTEILRAIECKAQLGHSATPWNAFDILANLERAKNNHAAALVARNQAIDSYLAYRREKGEPRFDTSEAQAILAQGREAAIAAIDDPDVHYSDAVEIMLALGLDRRPDSVHNDLRQ